MGGAKTRTSPLWMAMGAAVSGVLFGGAAVHLGKQGAMPSPSAELPPPPSAVMTPRSEPPPPAVEPAILPVPIPAATLADAVAQTRDCVVNLETPAGLGAGVIVDPRGIVVTNYHVIHDALRPPTPRLFGEPTDAHKTPTLTARFENDRTVTAEVLVADPEEDLAVLKLVATTPDERFAAAQLGTSSALRVGQEVFAVGNPFGLPHTVSRGIVSATTRTGILAKEQLPLIQLDASINLGNSGGPLFNLQGELVGIVTARRQQAQGIAFALPMDHVRGFLRAVTDPEGVRSGAIGVNLTLGKALASDVTDLGYKAGLFIERVVEDRAADRAGLKAGDTVVALRGKRLDGLPDRHDPEILATHLQASVRSMFPGERLPVTVVREGERVEIEIEIESATKRDQTFIDAEDLLGLRLDPQQDDAVIAGVRAGSPLARFDKTLQGVRLVRVMGEPIDGVEGLGPPLAELRRLVRKGGATPTVFLGVRDPSGREAEIPIRIR